MTTFPNPTPIFPNIPGITYSVHKRPTWASLEFMSVSGRRVSSPQQAIPLWEFELILDFLRDQTQNSDPYQQYAGKHELTLISQLFNACAGKYGQFFFTDPSDCSRLKQQIGVGDGATHDFIAVRTWGSGPLAADEPVGGINLLQAVYLDNVPITSSAYTFTGNVITFTGDPPAPGQVLAIDFTFYYLLQFLEDQHDYDQFMTNLWRLGSCKMRSVKQ